MEKLFAILAIVVSFSAQAQQDPPLNVKECKAHIPYGAPVSRKESVTVICRRAYLLEHDNNAKIPAWVAYTLTPEHATGCYPRSNAFASDKSLKPGYRAELKDYLKSGYDMGHQANEADMAWSLDTGRESFLLSNMAPQLPGFNRGIWKKLEDQTRAWVVDRQNPILIYVGPIYSAQDKVIGANNVVVPHGFYKILVDTKTSEVLIFKFAHEAARGSLNQFLTSLAEVQKVSGNFFPMPKDYKISSEIWPSSTKNVVNVKRGVCAVKP
jgi:endonuclease G